MDLKIYKHASLTIKPNYQQIPCTMFQIDDEGAHEFNMILEHMDVAGREYAEIKRTPSGGISTVRGRMRLPAKYLDVQKNSIEAIIIDMDGMWRFQFRRKYTVEKDEVSGKKAFTIFCKCCEKHGVDLDKYGIENGEQVKRTIPDPLISLLRPIYVGKTFENVHHIDFRSSHMSGLALRFPEFYPVVEDLYINRKTNPVNKHVLTHTFGMMQSKYIGYKFAHLSKAMLEHTNANVIEMTNRLISSGRVPIMHNTDGIWYTGDVYHGAGEGTALGQWHNDHVFCKFRAKSKGAYEYIEAGVYNAKLRGSTNLDKIKPRELWSWGDIFSPDAEVQTYDWDEKKRRITKNGVVV